MKKKLSLFAVLMVCIATMGLGFESGKAYGREDESQKIDLNDCTIEGIADCDIAEEGESKPPITVKYGDTVLVEKVDYYYTGQKSNHVGTATGVLNGIGNYKGDVSFQYDVLPVAPILTSANGDKKYVSAGFRKVRGVIDGFEMQISETADFAKIAKSTSKAGTGITGFGFNDLKDNTTYYIRVRGYNVGDKKTYYSRWSNVKSAKTKAAQKKVNKCKVKAKNFVGTYKKTNKKVGPSAGDYNVIINKIDKYGDVHFRVRYLAPQGRYVYYTEVITAPVVGKKANFTWKDGWGNEGKGTLYLDKKHKIRLKIKQTYTASNNRNTLALKKTVSLKYVSKKHALGNY